MRMLNTALFTHPLTYRLNTIINSSITNVNRGWFTTLGFKKKRKTEKNTQTMNNIFACALNMAMANVRWWYQSAMAYKSWRQKSWVRAQKPIPKMYELVCSSSSNQKLGGGLRLMYQHKETCAS